MIHPRHAACLGALLTICLAGPAARADENAQSVATIPAVPTDASTSARVRQATASVFLPAPMPGESEASTPRVSDPGPDTATLHPEILSMRDDNGGSDPLGNASSDYDHQARIRPAGGMGLTIPMQ